MTLAVVLFCASAAMAKDIRTAVFKVAQMKCENCVRKISNNIRFEKGTEGLPHRPEDKDGNHHV